jgi:hypothetical protein
VTAPLPPGDLARRKPETTVLPAGATIHRFYTAKFEPKYFDRSLDGRLNSRDGTFGVLYAAKERSGAFAETFLRQPGRTLIDAELLGRKAYVRFRTTSPLTLIKFAGPGLAMLGATAEIVHSGLPYDVPQAWSQALWQHPLHADGIAYYARHDDEVLCYAIFDRGGNALVEAERDTNLDQDWFWRLALKYRIGLAPE